MVSYIPPSPYFPNIQYNEVEFIQSNQITEDYLIKNYLSIIGNAVSNTTTTFNGIIYSKSILPIITNTYDIGTTTNIYNNFYIKAYTKNKLLLPIASSTNLGSISYPTSIALSGYDASANDSNVWINTVVPFGILNGYAQQNIAIGYSLSTLISGYGNVAISDSLNLCSSGSLNTALGYQSGSSIATGNKNSVLGYNSGSALTTTDHDNLCIGHQGVAGSNNTSWLVSPTISLINLSSDSSQSTAINIGTASQVMTLTLGSASNNSGLTIKTGSNHTTFNDSTDATASTGSVILNGGLLVNKKIVCKSTITATPNIQVQQINISTLYYYFNHQNTWAQVYIPNGSNSASSIPFGGTITPSYTGAYINIHFSLYCSYPTSCHCQYAIYRSVNGGAASAIRWGYNVFSSSTNYDLFFEHVDVAVSTQTHAYSFWINHDQINNLVVIGSGGALINDSMCSMVLQMV